jgi:hypothetical protein
MKKFLIIFLLFLTQFSTAQDQYEFLGVLRLNGDKTEVISYRLVFVENKGVISGYSITDLYGQHETKNAIEGTFNKSKNTIKFRESDILYTKSTIGPESFCYVNFEGKVNIDKTNAKIDGDFKGLFENKKKCIDGNLTLVSLKKIEKTVNLVAKKMEKSKKVDNETKEKFNPLKMLDSLKINKLSKDENLNVFWKGTKLKLQIWDSGQEDEDIINLYHNDKLLLKNYTLVNKKLEIDIVLNAKENIFRIIAVNEGLIAPNTAQILLIDEMRVFELMSNLKKGESSTISIIKK